MTQLEGYEPHIGETRQYWRDIILGVNDGLVSVFLLVIGVVGGGLTPSQVLLTGVAGALAGAVSMAAGEYLATKSQDEVLSAELELEQTHIAKFRDAELDQLRGYFTDMGVRPGDLESVMSGFVDNDKAILNAMAALEFGFVDSERRSPYRAMLASGGLFLAGSAPSVLPFALSGSIGTATLWAAIFTLVGLFTVGVVKARVSRTGQIRSGLENLVIAGLGGVVAWVLGRIVGGTLG
ncbi:MAG: VIT1/CCC1 transporter family protein [Actinobacteria bacterium]|nr:VIT1/CCC1 transporter family protein [Actinomycetota bacterium]MCI0544357.1 VIT1/CCC1 transporter family protein [Actinomycetota bacterium]